MDEGLTILTVFVIFTEIRILMNYKLLFVLLLAGCASAQKAVTPEDFAKTITAQDLKNHLTIIASAEMEGLLTCPF